MRALIIAPNISVRMGGEAILPFHYIRELAARGVEIVAATHGRTRQEVLASPIAADAQFHFISDAFIEKAIHQAGRLAPSNLADSVFNTGVGLSTMARLGKLARRLDAEIDFDVAHQPTPVSPQFPSFLTGLRAPLIIGPLNGAMDAPTALGRVYGATSERAVSLSRRLSTPANRIARGKSEAEKILVANERTRAGLPAGVDPARVEIMVENGVVLGDWAATPMPASDEAPLFVYVGRLVWWKGVDMLIDAFASLGANARLLIIGDGDERATLEEQAKARQVDVEFAGFVPQTEIARRLGDARAVVLPSFRECGGAAILEAFACARPAIALDWGGPADYITPETGVLIAPGGREEVVAGLADAIGSLAGDRERAARMGEAARRRVEANYSWSTKADAMLRIYESVCARARA